MRKTPQRAKSILANGLVVSAIAVMAACGGSQNDMTAGMDHDMAGHEGHQMAAAKPLSQATPVEVPAYADNFRLIDQNGVGHELNYHSDAKAVVIMTHGNGCPIARGAMPDYQAIAAEYEAQGAVFYLLNSNLQDNRGNIKAEAEEYGITLPILDDDAQLVGEHLGVQRTAEVFVLDPAKGFKIVYHGPMDDRQTYERQRAEAENTYLVAALDQLVAGEEVTVEGPALSPGCLVNFPERDNRSQFAEISYSEEIAPILVGKCADCHQEGGIGPWAMTDYDAIRGWAPMIREVVRTKRMPPWHADPHIGNFEGDRSLTKEETQKLVHWIEAGAPRGEGPDPLTTADLVATDWPLGEPDLILDLPAFEVPATGLVDYQHPIALNPLKEEKWIKATSFKVGGRQVVHHILSGYIPEVPEDGIGDTSRWSFSTGGYAVGAESTIAPEDSGVPLPVGGAIGYQMHYTTAGKPITDASQMGLYFHDEKPTYLNRTTVIIDVSVEIEPNESRHQEVAYMNFPHDAILIQAFPHAHYRGHASKLTIQYPDGEEEVLLSLPKYDFNWQRSYVFEEPVEIPAGSKLIAHYVYDNSAKNFANPDPDVTVTWGEQSHEEMLYTSLIYRIKGETTDNMMQDKADEIEANRFYYAMDDNMDGTLQQAELKGMVGNPLKPFFSQMDANSNGGVEVEEFTRAQEFLRKMRPRQRTDAGEDDDANENGGAGQ